MLATLGERSRAQLAPTEYNERSRAQLAPTEYNERSRAQLAPTEYSELNKIENCGLFLNRAKRNTAQEMASH